MNTITLSDYVGYIFTEIVRAREIADMHSKQIAERYAEDEVLKSFSVPRFKIPEMNLAIPVLVAGAKFTNTLKFNMTSDKFEEFITVQLNNVVNQVKKSNVKFVKINDIQVVDIKTKFKVPSQQPKLVGLAAEKNAVKKSASSKLIDELYDELVLVSDTELRKQLVEVRWANLLQVTLKEEGILDVYEKNNPNGELYFSSLDKLLANIENNYIVDSVKVDNLLVSPLTNIVKEEGDENSIFMINARIEEEGVFIKTISDENGNDTKIVDFE